MAWTNRDDRSQWKIFLKNNHGYLKFAKSSNSDTHLCCVAGNWSTGWSSFLPSSFSPVFRLERRSKPPIIRDIIFPPVNKLMSKDPVIDARAAIKSTLIYRPISSRSTDLQEISVPLEFFLVGRKEQVSSVFILRTRTFSFLRDLKNFFFAIL